MLTSPKASRCTHPRRVASAIIASVVAFALVQPIPASAVEPSALLASFEATPTVVVDGAEGTRLDDLRTLFLPGTANQPATIDSAALARIALARIDLESSALARIALARIDLESIAVGNPALDEVLLSQIPLRTDDWASWADFLAGTRYAGAPLQTLSLLDILQSDDPLVVSRRALLDLGSLDLAGTLLGSLPIASVLLGGVPLGDIPLDVLGGVPVDGEDEWCTALLDLLTERGLDCADLGLGATSNPDASLVAAALAGVPLESLALARIPLENLPESGLDADSPLAAISLSPSELASSALARIALARISTDPVSSALARIDLADIDLASSALAEIALARIDLQSSSLAALDVDSIDLASSALAGVALARIDTGDGSVLDGVDLGSLSSTATSLADIALARINVQGTPLGDTALARIGVTGTPLADIPLARIGPTSSLRNLPLNALDLTGAPFAALTLNELQASFGVCDEVPESVELSCSTPLALLDLTGHTLGELLDVVGVAGLGTTTLGAIIPAGFDASLLAGTLSQLYAGLTFGPDEEPLDGDVGDLALEVGDLVGTLAELLDALPDATLADIGILTLADVLALAPDLEGLLGDLITQLDATDLAGATLGDLLTFLTGELAGTVADLLSTVTDVQNLDLGSLGDLLALITGGVSDLGTLADLLRDLNGETGLTLADLIMALVAPHEFDWESIALDANDLAAIKLAGARVHYTATIDLTCGDTACPAGLLLDVTLPDGFAFAGGVDGAGNPEIAGQVLRFAVPDATTSGAVTIEFDATPVIGDDATATAQLRDAAEAPVGAPATVTTDVVVGVEPDPGSAAAPRSLAPDSLYIATLQSSDEVHYWYVDVGSPGERLSLFLGNLHEDYDLVLYGPPGANAPLRGAAEDRVLPLDTSPQSLDPLNDVAGTEPREDVFLLDRLPYAIAADRQSGDDRAETIETGPLEVGRYLVQVTGYNGAFTDVPYTLRAALTDSPELGDCDARAWPTPPSDFDPAASDVDASNTAVFLVNRQRLAATFGETRADDVLAGIDALIDDAPGGLDAGVLALDEIGAVNDAYEEWDQADDRCDPQKANDIVRAIGDALDAQDLPDLESLVVVGADDIIPFSRVRDATTVANEQDYAATFEGNNELVSALARGYVLTDDPLADPRPVASADREVFVPDVGIGRLVETPEDITGALDAFVDANGVLQASTAFSSGYDFLTDGARAVADALENPDGDAALERNLEEELVGDHDLTGDTWTDEHLRQLVFETTAPAGAADLLSLNAHFDHSRLLPGLGNAENAEDELVTIEDVSGTTAGSLLFSMGCHSGLSVPASAGGSIADDWAETFVENGALWVGNTGFGYGDTEVVALSEQLMTNFAQNLDGGVAVGTALAQAKQRYLADLGVISPYDEKVLMQTTLFGLPMYELANPAPLAPTPHTPPTLVAVPGAAGLQQAVVDKSNITFTPSDEDDDEPRYWSIGGRIQATQYRPIQPRMTVDVTPAAAGISARGALITDLTSNDVLAFPRIFRPVVHNGAQERTPFIGDSAFPAAIQSVTSFESRQGTRQQLVLVPGQFRTSSSGLVDFGTQRLYSKVNSVVYYGDDQAVAPSQPASILFADGAHVGASAAFVVETDALPADVLRVYVLYTAEGMGGEWQGIDLGLTGDRWMGNELLPPTTPTDARMDYIVQVVTKDGQVSVASNKGRFFEAVTPTPVGPISFVTTSTSSGGWYRDTPLTFTLSSTPTLPNLEYSVDGAAFQPYSAAGFTVSGEGLHRLRARSAGDPSSASSLVVPIDTLEPDVGPRDPLVTPPPTGGWNGPAEPTVRFFRDGDRGVISSGADTVSYTATGAQPTTSTQTAHDDHIDALVSTEGITSFTYWSTDRAGNDNDTKDFDVRYDETRPTIPVPTAPPTWVKVAPTPTVLVTDPLPAGSPATWAQSSKLKSVTFTLDTATIYQSLNLVPAGPAPQSLSVVINPTTVDLQEGITGVTIRAEDVAGNVRTSSFEIWFDETAPTITFVPPTFANNLLATTQYGGAVKPRTVFAPEGTFLKEYPAQGGKIPTYLLNSTVIVPYHCDDPPATPRSSGINGCEGGVTPAFTAGAPVVNGTITLSRTAFNPAFNTSTPGVKMILIASADVAGNVYLEVFTYRVVYKIEMVYDHKKGSKSGSTSPIKIKLRDVNGVDVGSASIALKALEIRLGGSNAAWPGGANPGGTFQWNASSKTYQFNAKLSLPKNTYGLAFQTSNDPGPTNRFVGPWTPYRAEFVIS